jgi:acetyl-CoA C-acetyltransferase
MTEAFVVDAIRTPVGRKNGGLAGAHPADLGAHVIRALLERTGLDPMAVDDVVSAVSTPSGPRPATSPGPVGWPPVCRRAIPGVTVDRSAGPRSRPFTSRRRLS